MLHFWANLIKKQQGHFKEVIQHIMVKHKASKVLAAEAALQLEISLGLLQDMSRPIYYISNYCINFNSATPINLYIIQHEI